MSDALGFARRIAGDRRVVAILGDMRELGSHAAAAHANLAHDAAAHADLVLTVGPEMRDHLVPRVRSKREARAFGDVPSLLRELDGLLKEGDVVLVKGSQNTLFLERVTERLLADRRDAELLPRRGARWDAARAVA